MSLPTRMRLDISALSDVGKVREKNEDAYAVVRLERSMERLHSNLSEAQLASRSDETGHVLLIADGMGGMAAGEVASHGAVITALRLIAEAPRWALRLDDPETREAEIRQMWDRGRMYLTGVHASIRGRAAADPRLSGMGTTLTSVFTVGSDLFVMHVGDSRAYLFSDGVLQKLTRDHTVAQSYVDLGVMKESDPAARRLRHVLTQAVGGPDDDLQADMHALQAQDGDRLLLCTDGLTNVVDEDEITEVLGNSATSRDACRALIDLALEYGAPDNVTAVVAGYSISE
jgi:serine/threonine protein phosphatase PrpC